MRVIDMEDIILAMRNQTQFVLRCEEVFHDKISAAAAAVLSAAAEKALRLPDLAVRLRQDDHCHAPQGVSRKSRRLCLSAQHGQFLPPAGSASRRRPEDWESPYCVNWNLLFDCIDGLAAGKTVQVPWYDFKTGSTGGFRPMTAATAPSSSRRASTC